MTSNHRKTTSTSTTYYHSTTTTTTTHQRRATQQQQHPPWTSTSLTRPHPSQILTRPLTPILTLAAYGSLIITALSALIGLILASYGLSAWDDAKDRFSGLRGSFGKGVLVGKDFVVGALTPTAFQQSSVEPANGTTTIPRRAAPEWTYSTDSSKNPRPATGYEVHTQDEEDDDDTKGGRLKDWDDREGAKEPTQESGAAATPPNRLPPRPPISVLIASLFLTLIVLSARLMVVWWMGQQAQKNSSHAFRNAQRAFEAANDDHELTPIQLHLLHHHHHRQTSSSSSSSSTSPTPPHHPSSSSGNRLSKSSSSSSSHHSFSQDL